MNDETNLESDARIKRKMLRDMQKEIGRELDYLNKEIKARKRRLFVMYCTLNPSYKDDRKEEVESLKNTYENAFALEKEQIEGEISNLEYKTKPLYEASMKIQFEIEELITNENFFTDWF